MNGKHNIIDVLISTGRIETTNALFAFLYIHRYHLTVYEDSRETYPYNKAAPAIAPPLCAATNNIPRNGVIFRLTIIDTLIAGFI